MNQTPIWLPPEPRGRWSRLSPVQRVGLIGAALILPCCGGVTAIGALSGSADPVATEIPLAEQPTGTPAEAEAERAEAGPVTEARPATEAAVAPVAPAATTAPARARARTTVTLTITRTIAFPTRTVEDDDLAEGRTRVRTRGAAGMRTLTYAVTLVGGKEKSRKLVGDVVTRKPVTKVVVVGTKPAGDRSCDPNYDPCVPVASDVDCVDGRGNGPAFVDGPIRVTGDDPYDLDRDGDGIACDR